MDDHARPRYGGLNTTPGQPLAAGEEPPLGAHLVTPRRGYLHHGIYVGGGKVVHYAGLGHGLRRAPVEEVAFSEFAHDYPLWVKPNATSNFDCGEVIRRARSRVGENRYRLWSNYCEHFCEWCLRGEHRSYQVETWRAYPGHALQVMIRFIMQPRSAPGVYPARVSRQG